MTPPPDPARWPVAPRSDAIGAVLLMAFGTAAAAGAWRMDRLEQQGATLYSAPGLWPGIVGAIVAALGVLLGLRALRRARQSGWHAAGASDAELVPRPRFVLAIALFFGYALLLVGRGLPFWLGTALFVTAFVFLFRHAQGAPGSARSALVALACGAATAAVVTLTFEQLFFVRLP